MADQPKQTNIQDPQSATDSLAAMAAYAEEMQQKVKGIVQRIGQHEAGRPWGTAPEFGGRFEAVYRAGQGGADFVKDHVDVLATETVHGLTLANEALHGSLDVDHDGAQLFKVAGTDSVDATVKGINEARTGVDKQQSGG